MIHKTKKLIVARDRGHAKVLLENFFGDEVITASEFFDRVRVIAFIHRNNLRLDEHALMPMLARYLSNHDRYNLQLLRQFSSLFSSCYHGTKTPLEIYHALVHFDLKFTSVFFLLNQVDESLRERGLVNGVQALYHAWQILKDDKNALFGFRFDTQIELFHLVDLTLLEIEVIKTLSKHGLRFILHFPLDIKKRGINTVVDFIARQFENEHDLGNVDIIFDDIVTDGPLKNLTQNMFDPHEKLNFSEDEVSVYEAFDVVGEAQTAAQKVAYIKTMYPQDKIAVVVRSLDVRSLVYKQWFKKYQIPLRDRKGQSLIDSKAGTLLHALIDAKISTLAKKDLLVLMHHPLFSHRIFESTMRSTFLSLIDKIGIDDRIFSYQDGSDRFHEKIQRMSNTIANEEEKNSLIELCSWLSTCKNFISFMSLTNTVAGHAQDIIAIMEKVMIGDDESQLKIGRLLKSISHSKGNSLNDPKISLRDFRTILFDILGQETIAHEDVKEMDAIDFLPLPELLGKKFDHIFILDMAFGKLPKNSIPDSLINDQARIQINNIFKKPILRVYFEDPFEASPTPPRQALEPLWFLGAQASATKSIHFSYAARDESGQEQVPSDFFSWLSQHLTIVPHEIESMPFSSIEDQQFYDGIRHRMLARSHVIMDAYKERHQAFTNKTAASFAFAYNKKTLIESFSGRLDSEPVRALTPSLIESFSECHFKGLMGRIFGIADNVLDHDDIEPTIIGQIAHRALEIFFSKKIAPCDEGFLAHRLSEIIHQVCLEYSTENFIKNPAVLSCHAEILSQSLLDLVVKMLKEDFYQKGSIVALEKGYGLGNALTQGVKISVNDQSYILGGRIDRIDRIDGQFIVTDYKLSGMDFLKAEISSKDLLLKSFQMPIYMRLVDKNLAHGAPVSFVYASIKEGEFLSISRCENSELFERIFDDSGEEGFAKRIDAIFAPIKNGQVLATAGDHCRTCDLQFVCRRMESSNHAT